MTYFRAFILPEPQSHGDVACAAPNDGAGEAAMEEACAPAADEPAAACSARFQASSQDLSGLLHSLMCSELAQCSTLGKGSRVDAVQGISAIFKARLDQHFQGQQVGSLGGASFCFN